MPQNHSKILEQNKEPITGYDAKVPGSYIQSFKWLMRIPASELSFGAKAVYSAIYEAGKETGKFFIGQERLAIQLGISVRRVQRYCSELVKLELIKATRTDRNLNNNYYFKYNKYMDLPLPFAEQHGECQEKINTAARDQVNTYQSDTSQMSSRDTTNLTSRDTSQMSCISTKSNNKVKDIMLIDPNGSNDPVNMCLKFDEFWKAYPRKVSKQKSMKIWKSKKLDRFIELILANLALLKKTEWDVNKGLKFVPYPSTYLNSACWRINGKRSLFRSMAIGRYSRWGTLS